MTFDEHLPADGQPGRARGRGRPVQRRPRRPRLSSSSCRCPRGIDEAAALLRVDPAKDVDGLHPMNLGRLVMGAPGPLPCTPAGIVELLAAYEVPVEGRHVVIIGRGLTIGRPLALLLALKRPGLQRRGDRRAHGGRRPGGRSRAAPTSWSPRPGTPGSSPPTWCKPGRRGRGRGHELGGQEAAERRRRRRGRGRRLDHAAPRRGRPDDARDAPAQRRGRPRSGRDERRRRHRARAGREALGQLHGARRGRRPQGQAARRRPGQAPELPAPRPARRALVRRVRGGHRDPRGRRGRSWPRARASTSPSDRRTGARTAGSTRSSSSRSRPATTSARTTSSGSKTTSGARPSRCASTSSWRRARPAPSSSSPRAPTRRRASCTRPWTSSARSSRPSSR